MRNKIYIISLLLMVLLATSTAVTAVRPKDHEIIGLVEVAKTLEGDILGYSVHGHIKVLDISFEEIGNLLKRMGFNGLVDESNTIEENHYRNILVDWFWANNYYKLTVTENGDNCYVSLSVDLDPKGDVFGTYDLVKSVLKELTEDVHVTTSIYKELDGNLDNLEIIEQISNGFRMLSASLVNDYEDGKSFAFLGYSPFLVNSIDIEGKLYNLHMAVHFDEYSDSYHLVIANPIIESSY